MDDDSDFVWKLLAAGNGGVGKTCLLHQFIHHEFLKDTKLTIGVDFHKQILERKGYKISLVLWDLGGQERFRFMQPEYISGSDGVLLCFDLSRSNTLAMTGDWLKIIKKQAPKAPIILVGMKQDLVDDEDLMEIIFDANEVVSINDLVTFIPTSSKNNFNVDETIYCIVDELLKMKDV